MATIAKPLLLDETYREGNAALINILENITTATDKAAEAAASADVATQKADVATQKADVASTSATNAAQSYTNADAIAAQLTEYLATKETLTAPAVDKTLLIEGAAADSKVTGFKLGKQKRFEAQSISVVKGKIISSTYITEYDISDGEYIHYSVTEGETYKFCGYGINSDYCGMFYSQNGLNYILVATAEGAFEYEMTIPKNVTTVYINGKENVAPIRIYKQVYQSDDEYWEEYNKIRNDKLDKGYLDYLIQDVDIVSNYLTNSDTLEQQYYSGFATVILPVISGEKYKVTGYGANDSLCGLALYYDTTLVSKDIVTGVFTDYEVEIPNTVNKMLVNARPEGNYPLVIKKQMISSSSQDYWNDYELLKNRVAALESKDNNHIGISYVAEKTIKILMRGYSKNIDLGCLITPKTGNLLPDFESWSRNENNTNAVLVDFNNPEQILGSTSDFITPSIVYAVNNVNGDFADFTSNKLTGGWHTYGGTTDTTKTATARNISFRVYCDGVELVEGDSTRCNRIIVDIVNRLQGSNTEKEDGSGREIVEQHFKITFSDGFMCKIEGEVTALENVLYANYMGISTWLMPNKPTYFVGCRVKRGQQIPATEANRCGDKNCLGIMQVGDKDIYKMSINPNIDIGAMYANNGEYSASMSTGKAYMCLVSSGSPSSTDKMLALSEGDKIYWEGYFELTPKA